MRRSICNSEPNLTLRETPPGNLSIRHRLLPKGTQLRFDLLSGAARSIGKFPANIKEKQNIIWAVIPNGKALDAKKIEKPEISRLFEFAFPSESKPGTLIDPDGNSIKSRRSAQERQPLPNLYSTQPPFSTYTSIQKAKAISRTRNLHNGCPRQYPRQYPDHRSFPRRKK